MKKILSIITIIVLIFSLHQSAYKNDKSLQTSSTINIDKTIYLTFDDGPSENTIKILEILDKYKIQATFFVTGPSYKLKDTLLNEILNHGHSIAIHSYTHQYSKIYLNTQSYLDDFFKCLNWIKTQTNVTPNLYRFPGGSSNTISSKKEIQSIINSLYLKGYTHVDWNVDSFDSHYNNDYNAITSSTLNQIKLNEEKNIYNQIILMHDNTKKVGTLKALPTIIEKCLSKGYVFKVLSKDSFLYQHIKRPI